MGPLGPLRFSGGVASPVRTMLSIPVPAVLPDYQRCGESWANVRGVCYRACGGLFFSCNLIKLHFFVMYLFLGITTGPS